MSTHPRSNGLVGHGADRITRTLFVLCAALAACSSPRDPPPALDPGEIAFGVFGDGPYSFWEARRYQRMLADVVAGDVAFLIHVGDILGYGCTDELYAERRAGLDSLASAVVYTPGDNEWTDCHTEGRDPLDRLASLRATFFAKPGRSLGRAPLVLEFQAGDPAYPEFVENARWTLGGFVFATIHLVGSRNGTRPFDERTARHDEEVERRTAAAVAWLDQAFEMAVRTSAKGIVLMLHANLWNDPELSLRDGYGDFPARLAAHVTTFDGPVLLVHGDTHDQRVDQPLVDASGRLYPNFTRLETFGSPRIGWVRVVIDTVAGRFARYEPRLVRGW